MFYGAKSFDQSLDKWNVSNITKMSCMCNDLTSLNQSLNNWNDCNDWNDSDLINIKNMFEFNNLD